MFVEKKEHLKVNRKQINCGHVIYELILNDQNFNLSTYTEVHTSFEKQTLYIFKIPYYKFLIKCNIIFLIFQCLKYYFKIQNTLRKKLRNNKI